MTFDVSQVSNHFPLENFRPGQQQAIERVLETFDAGYKYVFLEGPTGSGKSAIGYTIAQFVQKAYYLCPQKFLQDQLSADFGENGKCLGSHRPMIDLKGRGTYPCSYYERMLDKFGKDHPDYPITFEKARQKIMCDKGECKRQGQSKIVECCDGKLAVYCPYFKRVYEALASHICLMNFHSFLFQTNVVHQFPKRDLLVIDECHVSEDVLLRFVELKISDKHLMRRQIKFPKLETVDEYLEFFDEIGLGEIIADEIKLARAFGDEKAEDEWTHLAIKYEMITNSTTDEWVVLWEESKEKVSRTVILRPVFVDEFAERFLFNKADHVLLMSATILSKEAICDSLGIENDEAHMLRLPCLFPAENRQLHFVPSGSMSFKNKAKTFPKLVADVTKICRKHANDRGIIHTHNFEICKKLIDECPKDVSSRFLHQKDDQFEGNKHLLIQKHKNTPNSVIIAPAMHEGLDLIDDLGRFQILCKVPYPPKADPQISRRMEMSPTYYDWRTATKLVQSYGRIIRHDGDFGTTYILDKDFEFFYKRIKSMLPSWFKEAIVWSSTISSERTLDSYLPT